MLSKILKIMSSWHMRKIKHRKQAKLWCSTYVKLRVGSSWGSASFHAKPDPDLDRHQHGNLDPDWHHNDADPQHRTVEYLPYRTVAPLLNVSTIRIHHVWGDVPLDKVTYGTRYRTNIHKIWCVNLSILQISNIQFFCWYRTLYISFARHSSSWIRDTMGPKSSCRSVC